jgi:hypothetical protein
MQIENGETTEISFPNPSSSAVEPLFIENNNVEEEEEQIEPLSTPSLSNDKEVSIEAHSFVTIPLETHHEPQASFTQCLKEPSYAKILKDPCKQASKFRNHCPKKILLSNRIGYLRWRNILLEGYENLKNKGWKGLVGHPNDRGKCGIFSFLFFVHHLSSFPFVILFHVISFLFLTTINLMMFVL